MKWVAIGASLLAVPCVFALEARLVDEHGHSIAGAQVNVIGRHETWVSDRDGKLLLPDDLKVPFEVLVTTPDGLLQEPIRVLSLDEEMALSVGAASSESMTVVTAIPDVVMPPAAALTVIGKADLQQRNPQRLADALEQIPGLGRIDDGATSVPSIRGLARSRSLILLDGARVSSERRAGPSATYLSPETIDELEVVRGPGSVAYGSEAFGGVIRASTRMAAPGSASTFNYALVGSSVNSGVSLTLDWSGSVGRGGALIGVHHRDYDDYQSARGDVPNSAAEDRGFRLGWQSAVGPGLIKVLWRTDIGRDIGKPSTDSNVTRTFYPEENSGRLVVGYTMPGRGAWHRFAWHLAWSDYQLITVRDRQASPTLGRRVSEADVDSNDASLRFETERRVGKANLILGSEVVTRFDLHASNRFIDFDLNNDVSADITEVAVDDARRIDAAVYAQLSRHLTRFSLSGGLRADRVTTKNVGGFFGDRSTGETALSGFAAATWHATEHLDLTAQAARGFREALLSDRYFRGISGRGFVVGNPSLKPETSQQLDLSARWHHSRWNAALYLYRYRIDDYIERFRNDTDFNFRNRERAVIRGVEFEVGMQLPHRFELQLGLQTLSGVLDADRDVPKTTPLADIPAQALLTTLRHHPSERWWWMIRTASFRTDDRPGEAEVSIPGYTLFDAGVGLTLSERISLQLLGRNLGDKLYPSSPDEVAEVASGRGVEFGVRGKW
jgi:iron complex outermembrane receptor protein